MGIAQSGRGQAGLVGVPTYVGRTKWARAFYDFAKDGGAIGSITMRGDAVPAGALILSATLHVSTGVLPVTTSTVALTIESAGDVRAAGVATVTTNGKIDGTAATQLTAITRATAPLVPSVDRSVVMAIAAGTLTAGKFSVLIEYVELAP